MTFLFQKKHIAPLILFLLYSTGITVISLTDRSDLMLPFAIGIPAILCIATLLLRDIFSFFLFIVACIPLSIRLEDAGGGVGISLPFEPMLVLFFPFAMMYFLKNGVSKAYIIHPLTICLILQFAWIYITTCISHDQMVSVKFAASRFLYVFVFYVYLMTREKDITGDIMKLVLAYSLAFVPVILWSVYKHSVWNFAKDSSPFVFVPFYKDHTIYGSCVAILLPVLSVIFIHKIPLFRNKKYRWGLPALVIVFALALLFSFSRASWMGTIAATAVYIVIRLGARKTHIIFLTAVAIAGIIYRFDDTYREMKRAQQKKYSSISEHFISVSNLNNNESNLERVNRWASAVRMFEERPWTGFGPSTYEKVYGKFQASSQLTRISTFTGNKGDAHSEWLSALSEQGIPGLVLWALQVIITFWAGLTAYYRHTNREWKYLTLGVWLGLITYFVHSFVNNFTKLDEFAPLFWIFTAFIVISAVRSRQVSVSA